VFNYFYEICCISLIKTYKKILTEFIIYIYIYIYIIASGNPIVNTNAVNDTVNDTVKEAVNTVNASINTINNSNNYVNYIDNSNNYVNYMDRHNTIEGLINPNNNNNLNTTDGYHNDLSMYFINTLEKLKRDKTDIMNELINIKNAININKNNKNNTIENPSISVLFKLYQDQIGTERSMEEIMALIKQTESEQNIHNKYLKYKMKYLTLKNKSTQF